MTFEEKLKQKIEEAQKTAFVPLDTLPSTITAKILEEPEFKADGRGNEGLYIVLIREDETKVVQKYTKTLYQEFESALEECGGLKALQTDFHQWTQRKIGRAFNQRYYPIPNPKTKAKTKMPTET